MPRGKTFSERRCERIQELIATLEDDDEITSVSEGLYDDVVLFNTDSGCVSPRLMNKLMKHNFSIGQDISDNQYNWKAYVLGH